MRAETVARVVAVVLMLALPLGCGSSGSGGSSIDTGGGTGTGTTGGGSSTGGTSTGGPIPGLGAACTYDVSSGVDSCSTYDLECTSLISWVFCEGLDYPCPPNASNLGGSGTCALPQEIAPCMPRLGCQDAGPAQNGESDNFICASDPGSGDLCLYSCTHSSDCANITETCQVLGGSNVCNYNYCNPDRSGKYFNACDDLGTGDGQCLSWGPPGDTAAVCYQNGSVAAGAACQTYRTNGSGDQQCVFGQFCAPSPSDQTVGVCMQVADGTASHPCSDAKAHLVVDVIGANFGVCAQDCTADTDCPTNLSCQPLSGGKKGCMP